MRALQCLAQPCSWVRRRPDSWLLRTHPRRRERRCRRNADMTAPNPVTLAGIELVPWQLDACDAWQNATRDEGPWRGTLEIFTGGGKSLIALECLRRAI